MRRKLRLAAAVALALPGMAFADDYIFTPTNPLIPPTGDYLDPTQWVHAQDGTTGTLPGAFDRADIAGGSIANFLSTNSSTVRNLYIGGDNDGGTSGANLVVNTAGTGTLNQSAGTITSTQWTLIGQRTGIENAGTFNLSGGTFHQAGNDHFDVGNNGYGTFNITTGGVAQIDNSFDIGRGAGSFGTATISGATSKLLVDQSAAGNPILFVGDNGNGTLNVNGGLVDAQTDIIVGNNNGSTGLVNQTGGTVNVGSVAHTKWLFIGNNGGSVGTYNLSGGNLNLSQRLYIGNNGNNSSGTLNVSGGTLSARDYIYVGNNGSATVNLSGGTITTTGDLRVGASNGSVGVMTQSGNSLLHVGGWFYIADGGGSTGTYNMNGGTVTVSGRIYVAQNGSATLNQTAGMISDTDQFLIAANAGSTGTFNISGGTLNGNASGFIMGNGNSTVNQSGGLVTANWIQIGDTGTATYNLSGGTVTAQSNEFTIGRNGGSIGVMNTSNTATINVVSTGRGLEVGGDTSGGAGNGTLNVTNGVLTVNAASIRIGSTAGSTGVMNVLGTSVVNLSGFMNVGADAAANAQLNLNDNSTINALTGLAGFGNITNAGTGVSHLNLGSAASTANRTFDGIISDTATGQIAVTLKGGTQVFSNNQTYTGPTVISAGTLQLGNGGTTGSLATANISSSGTLAINRSDNYSFTNQLSGTGGLLVNGAGTVTLSNNSYAYTGPTVINPGTGGGTLALVSANSNNITNSSSINVLSGTLDVTGLNGGNGIVLTNQALRGAGSVTGNVSFKGGSITPGNSPNIGNITIGGNLSLTNGAAANFVLGTPGTSAAAVGVGSVVNVNGNLALTNGLFFNPLNNSNANGQGNLGSGYYELFGYTGVLSGFDATNTFIAPQNAPYTFLNVANAGGGGMIEVLIGALKNFTWTGAQNSNWDINTSVNWTDGTVPTIFQNQFQVNFTDTNPLNGTKITNSNIQVTPSGVIPLSVTFNNNTVDYSFTNVSGSNGISGTTGIVKNGTGTVSFNSPNSFTGPVIVNAGILSLADSAALGNAASFTLTNGASLQLKNSSVLPNIPFAIQGAGTASSLGAINNVSGSNVIGGSVTLNGDTTFNLNGQSLTIQGALTANTNLATAPVVTFNGTSVLNYTGGNYQQQTTIVNGGTVVVSNGFVGIGSNTNGGSMTIKGNGGFATTGDFNVGDIGDGLGVLTVQDNATAVANTFSVGKFGSTQGVVVINGGSVTVNGGDSRIGGYNPADANAVGTIDLNNGAKFNSHGNFQIGANGVGSLTINGGATFDQTAAFNGFPIVGRFAGGYGVLTVNNGTFSSSQPGTFLMVGEDGTGVLNVGTNGTVISAANAGGVRLGNNLNGVGIANLGTGGTILTQAITTAGTSTTSTFNFHGGTLTAAVNNTAFMQGLTNAYIYGENAYINTGSNNITIAQGLSAPTGNGVSGIALTSSGSGYIGTPVVQLVGGDGTGATAIPIMGAGGTITGFKVTNPGVGYTVAPTVNIIGGGGTGAGAGALSLAANVSGNLVKKGTGVLTVSGNNTYGGSTLITEGTLRLGGGSFAANQPGLFEGLVDNGTNAFDNNLANAVPRQSIQLSTRYANSTVAGGSLNGGAFPNFPDNSTYGYSGILNISASNAGVITFGKNFDDSVLLAIDGQTIINDNVWNANPTGTATLAAGTHTLELRLGQGGGGVGPTNNVAIGGFGVAFSTDGGTTYQPFTDPGNGSLLQTGAASSVLPASSPVVMSSNTSLDVNGFPVAIGSLTEVAGATGHTVTLGNGKLTVGSLNTTNTFTGLISDTGGASTQLGGQLIKVGTGTLTLTANNTYSGGTIINGGAIQVGNNGATGAIGTGPIVNNTSLIVNRTGALSLPGDVSGSGTLSHIGTGVTTLSGSNGAYSGAISVNAGTLVAASASALGSGNIALSGNGTLSFAPTVAVFTPSITGFGGTGTNWTVNSNAGAFSTNAAIAADVLTLTEKSNGLGRSAFLNTPQNIANGFTTSFVYQEAAGNGRADGVTFTIQNDPNGVNALGDAGGNLGYGTGNGNPGIQNSAALEFNIYGGAAGGVGTALGVNGIIPGNSTTGGVNIGSGDPIKVTLSYAAGGSSITETLFDQTTLQQFTTSFALPSTLSGVVGGSNTALIGFTGATGGENALQTISQFAYGVPASVPTSLTYANAIQLSGTPTIDVAGGVTTTLTGPMTGSGSLTKGSAAGKLVLAPASALVALPAVTVNGGTLAIGAGTTPTKLTVSGLGTINSGGTLQFAQTATRVTNSIDTLSINGSGVLDLNNHNLLTNTPAATVRQYLTNGYNADGSGIGRWNGTGGISSSLAAAAYMANPLNPKFSVGYATVADNATTHLGLTGNQVLVKPTIPGDATLDGLVDIGDLNVVLSNYLSGNPARWGTGDFTYAGRTDITDLNIVLSNYFATSPYPSAASSAATPSAKTATSSAATLTGTPVASSATSAPVTANTVELDVDPVTGDAKLNGNGAKIASIQITSNGHLVPLSWNSLGDQGVPNWTDATDRTTTGLAEYDFKFNTKHDSKLINGVIDYGNIFSPGAAQDLVFQYGLVQPDGTTLSTITGNVVYAPEPTSLSLLGLGAIGLLKRRNRKAKGN
jgi:fibronectin-binding autotransporter adhesin